MPNWDHEMQKALEADGEKLRQLTGEEHGPYFLDTWGNRIECPYCGTTEGLRVACDGGGYIAPDYICEACFTGQDDGPCFDDLPEVKS